MELVCGLSSLIFSLSLLPQFQVSFHIGTLPSILPSFHFKRFPHLRLSLQVFFSQLHIQSFITSSLFPTHSLFKNILVLISSILLPLLQTFLLSYVWFGLLPQSSSPTYLSCGLSRPPPPIPRPPPPPLVAMTEITTAEKVGREREERGRDGEKGKMHRAFFA